jgi:hypothetical protein
MITIEDFTKRPEENSEPIQKLEFSDKILGAGLIANDEAFQIAIYDNIKDLGLA